MRESLTASPRSSSEAASCSGSEAVRLAQRRNRDSVSTAATAAAAAPLPRLLLPGVEASVLAAS